MNVCEPFIRRPVMITLVTLGILIFGVMAYRLLPVSDLPNVDFPTIDVRAALPGASPETMASSVATPLERQFSTVAGLDSMTSTSSQGNTRITIQFVLSRDLDAAAQDVQAAIAAAVRQLPSDMPTQSPETAELYRYAPVLEERLRGLPQLLDVGSDLQLKNPEVRVVLDRDKASALNVTAEQIEDGLFTAYGPRQISTIFAPNNDYQVIMELLPEYQRDPEALSILYLRSSSGQLVPLTTVATLTRGVGPMSVNHSGQLPSVTLSFDLQPGASLGEAVAEIERLARSLLPATITMTFQGTAQAFQSSMEGLGLLLVMAILVIYLVLGILYESFIHPITILSALPFAGFGALATLLLFNTELNISSFVGIIMLVGLVKKNGIIMIDFAVEAQRSSGKSAPEAIHEACIIRFRPIMMTTMAALMGTLPIALGLGAGAGARRPLGLAVVGGLLFSQFFTLYVTPVFYTYMDSFQAWLGRRFRVKPATHPASASASEPPS